MSRHARLKAATVRQAESPITQHGGGGGGGAQTSAQAMHMSPGVPVRVTELMTQLHDKSTRIRLLEAQLKAAGQKPVQSTSFAQPEPQYRPRPKVETRVGATPTTAAQAPPMSPMTATHMDDDLNSKASTVLQAGASRLERRLRAVARETAYLCAESRLSGLLKRVLRATARLVPADEVKLYLASAPGQTLHDITWFTPSALPMLNKFDYNHLGNTNASADLGPLVSPASLRAHGSGRSMLVSDAHGDDSSAAPATTSASDDAAVITSRLRTSALEEVLGPVGGSATPATAATRGRKGSKKGRGKRGSASNGGDKGKVAAHRIGWRSYLSVPLTFGGGLSLGVVECSGLTPDMFNPADRTVLVAFAEAVAGCITRFRLAGIVDSVRPEQAPQGYDEESERGYGGASFADPHSPRRYSSNAAQRLLRGSVATVDKAALTGTMGASRGATGGLGWDRAAAPPHVGNFARQRFRPFDDDRPAVPKPIGGTANYSRSPYKAPPVWPYSPRRGRGISGSQWHRRRLKPSTVEAISNILKMQPLFRGYRVRRWLYYQNLAASRIQALARGHLSRAGMRHLHDAANELQRSYRGFATRRQILRENEVARLYRGHSARVNAAIRRWAGDTVRRVAKGALGRYRARKRRHKLARQRAALRIQNFLRGMSTRSLLRTATQRNMMLERARRRLMAMSSADWNRFIEQRNPSTPTTVVAAAVCVLMNIPRPTWRKTQKLMRNAAFVSDLLAADKDDLPERELNALEEILKYDVIREAAKDPTYKAGQALAQYLLALV